MNLALRRILAVAATVLGSVVLVACGGGGGGGGSVSSTGSGTIAQQIQACESKLGSTNSPLSTNQMPVEVDAGPCAYFTAYGATSAQVQQIGSVNTPFTTVTICAPGTSNCATIDHVMIDTGSSGLRIMSEVLPTSLQLPNIVAQGANLYECIQFGSGFSWGSVRAADVKIAGEATLHTGGISVNIIGDSEAIKYPNACAQGYTNPAQDTVAAFGANGILGVGLFISDCGINCTISGGQYNTLYYNCPTTDCSQAVSAGVAVASQVSNPVNYFANDNQGIVLSLNNVTDPSGGMQTVSGTLTFGINSEANNYMTASVLGQSPSVYLADPLAGLLISDLTMVGTTSVAKGTGVNANDTSSIIDSGSNAVYLPISSTTSPTITVDTDTNSNTYGWFIPVPSVSVQAKIAGYNNVNYSTSVSNVYNETYTVASAKVLFSLNSYLDSALMGLSAPNVTSGLSNYGIDWGLPFFYGKSVAIVIEGNSETIPYVSPGGTASTGPLWAF